jgi:hypothetical protein
MRDPCVVAQWQRIGSFETGNRLHVGKKAVLFETAGPDEMKPSEIRNPKGNKKF